MINKDVINKDVILFRIADRQIHELLIQSMTLRWRYNFRYSLAYKDDVLLEFARDLEGAAISIAADCADRKLITRDDYRTIRNIIDHIGTGEKMEDIVW